MIFATSNPHKLEEARAILGPLGVRVESLDELGCQLEEPEEDGATFEDNARLKARYYAQHLGRSCLAEDSGLEVDALGGAPGATAPTINGSCASSPASPRPSGRRVSSVLWRWRLRMAASSPRRAARMKA
jgi:XTP/dITP diphosphohydrolase